MPNTFRIKGPKVLPLRRTGMLADYDFEFEMGKTNIQLLEPRKGDSFIEVMFFVRSPKFIKHL